MKYLLNKQGEIKNITKTVQHYKGTNKAYIKKNQLSSRQDQLNFMLQLPFSPNKTGWSN